MADWRSPFTDRRDELSSILKSIRMAALGRGGMTLLLGDVGVGKTRLMEEAAARIGLPNLTARCVAGGAPFQPLKAAFTAAGLPFGARREKAELEAVLVLKESGEVLAQVSARPEMTNELGELVQSMEQFLDQSLSGDQSLQEFRYGDATVVVETVGGFRAIALTRHQYLDLRSVLRRELEAITTKSKAPAAAVQAVAKATLTQAFREEALVSERSRFFQQVLDGILRLGTQKGAPGTVLIVDDLHEIDDDSFSLLQFLLRRARTSPVAVIAAARVSELRARSVLDDGLRTLEREGLLRRVPLDPFSPELVQELVALRYPGASVSDLATELWQRTRGNLLFIEEYLTTLEAAGAITRSNDGTWTIGALSEMQIPEGVRELLLSRIGGLDPEASKALEASAVLAAGITGPLVAAVARVPEGESGSALERLVAAGILRPASASVGSAPVAGDSAGGAGVLREFSFVHPLTREVVLDRISQLLRRRMHERAADALEALAGDARIFEVADHARQGRDANRAIGALIRAGDRALATVAPERAARLYDEARGFVQDLPEDVRGSRGLELALRSARTAQLLGKVEVARQAAADAVATADTLGDRRAVAEANEILGWIATNQGRWAEATVHFTRCIEAAKAAGDAHGILEGTRGIGKVLARQGRPAAARTYLEMCLEQARAAGDHLEMARVLIDVGSVIRAAGDVAGARAAYAEGIQEARNATNRSEEARGHLNLASLASDREEWPIALQEAERCLAAAEGAGDLRIEAFGRSSRGLARVGTGDLAGAEQDLTQAIGMFTALDEKYPLGVAYRQLGRLNIRRGIVERAKTYFDLSVVTLKQIGMPQEVAAGYLDLGRLFKQRGDHARAREYFRQAAVSFTEAGAAAGSKEVERELASLDPGGVAPAAPAAASSSPPGPPPS